MYTSWTNHSDLIHFYLDSLVFRWFQGELRSVDSISFAHDDELQLGDAQFLCWGNFSWLVAEGILHYSFLSLIWPMVFNIDIVFATFVFYHMLLLLWLYLFILLWYMLLSLVQLIFKGCVRYFSRFLKDKCISLLFRTKYIEKKFNLQLFFLPSVSRTFILSRTTTRYLPPWNFLVRKNSYMCNRGNARDVAACPDE